MKNMSEIGAVVKIADSHLCGWSSWQKLQFSCSLLKQWLITVLHVF